MAEDDRASRRNRSASYGLLLTAYGAMSSVLVIVVRQLGPPRAPRPGLSDAVLMGLGTFKLSRLVTKDKVLQPLRAPFVESAKPGRGSEINSQPAGTGLRRALGEVLTCPFCVSVWIATVFVAAFAVAPRAARLVASGLAAAAVADTSQYAYSGIQERAS
jgi:hypothetical protein